LAIRLGWLIDGEPDGQPNATATGDVPDEDGITFATAALYPGTVAQLTVYVGVNVPGASGFAHLNGWIDFNADGDWNDSGEQIFSNLPLSFIGLANPKNLSFLVPTNAVGPTFARFRFGPSGLAPTGYADNGEVEDYLVNVADAISVDWGDAPDNAAATGDDLAGIDDEDGIIYLSSLMPGGHARIDVEANGAGVLDAWLDFNADGDWLDASERIFSGQVLSSGTNILSFPVPLVLTNIAPASTFARLRFSSGGVPSFTGLALDGEVEDYAITIVDNFTGDDWGDAPAPYPTIGGAVHVILTGLQLGGAVDPESNGQTNSTATGDDITLIDDEDGVVFKTKLVAGKWATIEVLAGALGGSLDAWIDFNADGAWSSGPEQIQNAATLTAGAVNTVTFFVPQPSAIGPTFARFRLSTAGGLPPSGGAAVSGEVEDYMINLYQPQTSTNIIITNLFFNASNTVATVEWNAEANITYQMESSTNLMTNIWITAGPEVPGPVNWQTNNMSVETSKFYRVTAPWTE